MTPPTPRESARQRHRKQLFERKGYVPTVSRDLAWKCLYAGVFFYVSFALHQWAMSERFGPEMSESIRLAPEAKAPAERGVLEGFLAALLERDGRSS